jgi:hypothetical protein
LLSKEGRKERKGKERKEGRKEERKEGRRLLNQPTGNQRMREVGGGSSWGFLFAFADRKKVSARG